MVKRLLILGLSVLLFTSCETKGDAGGPKYGSAEVAEQSAKVNEFLDRKFDEAVARNPELESTLGLRKHYSDWLDRSDEHLTKELEIQRATVDSLHRCFKLDALDEQTRLSVHLAEEDLKHAEEDFKWRFHTYWISQLQGEHTDIPTFLVNVHKIDSLPDAEAYLSRLSKIGKAFDQVIWQLRKREEIGVLPPKFTFHYVTSDIKAFIDASGKTDTSNVLLTDFKAKVSKLKVSESEKAKLIEQAKTIIATEVKEAYQRLFDYWTALDTKVHQSDGVWSQPDGPQYYSYCLRHNTTTDISADSVFETGLREVARIKIEMHEIMHIVKFKNDSLKDFFDFLRSDKQFKYSNNAMGREKLRSECISYLDTIKQVYLHLLFNHIPQAPLVVMAVEKFRERSAPGAFYEDPSEDGSRPGRYYINLYNMNDEPSYQMEALCYHEGIPGHHMQIALAQELKSVPKFRRHGGNTAYVEGWALYAEKIPKEAGLYQNPYSDFGRLSMEIFRAARLVVDAGIHYKHWTKQQALDYMLQNTANAPGDCEHEVERYFLWPGQATGYKIGMMKILALRGKAQTALGSKFDIRSFHDVVLMNGPLPLNVLEELVDKWIAKTKDESAKN